MLQCEKEGKTLQQLTAQELHAVHELFDTDATEAVDINCVVERRSTQGGTGHDAVSQQLYLAQQQLEKDEEHVHVLRSASSNV